jgi:hypothetical protein
MELQRIAAELEQAQMESTAATAALQRHLTPRTATEQSQRSNETAAEARAAEAAMDWIQAQGVQGFYEDFKDN